MLLTNYDFYDIKAILELIANEFSMNIELNIKDMPFMEEGKSVEICYKNKVIGIMGELSTKAINNLENGKLVKGEVLYLELYLDDLEIGSTAIENVSKYPSILREYNFLVPKDEIYAEYVKEIRDLSDYITSVKVNDIYKGKGVKDGFVSVLLEIEYSSMDKTLLTEEVEEIENKMYTKLKNRNIELKM
jgi:phenylalanyl-tRNA synthetase beta chain